MKTNIFFLIAAVAATTFASCSKEQQTVYTNPAHVRFSHTLREAVVNN